MEMSLRQSIKDTTDISDLFQLVCETLQGYSIPPLQKLYHESRMHAIHSIFFLPVHPTTGIERSYLPHQKFILIIYLNMTFMKTTHNIKVSN